MLIKTLYSQAVTIDRLKSLENIEEKDLSVADIKFQYEGNTIIHMFCLDARNLKIVLDFILENKKEYLNAILMKNDKGFTPLDLSIHYDSRKTTDLLLRYLSHLTEGAYSRQIYMKFPELLKFNLASFHEYLGTCTFQTSQMKNIKFLSLKEDSDQIRVAHSTCVLNRDFFEKHTTEGIQQKKLREKVRKLHDAREQMEEDEEKKKKEEKEKQDGKDKFNEYVYQT